MTLSAFKLFAELACYLVIIAVAIRIGFELFRPRRKVPLPGQWWRLHSGRVVLIRGVSKNVVHFQLVDDDVDGWLDLEPFLSASRPFKHEALENLVARGSRGE